MQTSEHPSQGEKMRPEKDAHIGPFGYPVGMSKKSPAEVLIDFIAGLPERRLRSARAFYVLAAPC